MNTPAGGTTSRFTEKTDQVRRRKKSAKLRQTGNTEEAEVRLFLEAGRGHAGMKIETGELMHP